MKFVCIFTHRREFFFNGRLEQAIGPSEKPRCALFRMFQFLLVICETSCSGDVEAKALIYQLLERIIAPLILRDRVETDGCVRNYDIALMSLANANSHKCTKKKLFWWNMFRKSLHWILQQTFAQLHIHINVPVTAQLFVTDICHIKFVFLY